MLKEIGKDTLFPKLFAYFFIICFVIYCGYRAVNGIFPHENKEVPQGTGTSIENINPENTFSTSTAKYQELKASYKAQIPTYEIKADLSNVMTKFRNRETVESLNAKQKGILAKNGFVVIPKIQNGYDQFYALYENNRYSELPNFITTDSVLHTYHLIFNGLLEDIEKNRLNWQLKLLSQKALEQAEKQYQQLKDTSWENAAKRNLAFFNVGAKLLDDNTKVNDAVKDCVNTELNRIKNAKGIMPSCVFNIGNPPIEDENTPKEDYSQYIPRGNYEKSEDLKKYFKTMMWFGRGNFALRDENNVKATILMTYLIQQDAKIPELYNDIYVITSFFVGKSDDISYAQIQPIIFNIYGQTTDLKQIANDKEKLAKVVAEYKKLNPPQINSIPIFNKDINPNREELIQGFRFMGQRYTIDADIFQRLIDREVPGRMLPNGLDIPSAMGSKDAYDVLDKDIKATQFSGYVQNMSKIKEKISTLPQSAWTQNLYWAWMGTLSELLKTKGVGYPVFMQNTAWNKKSLNAYMGSYAELKHDTILYAKQVYAELGGGGEEYVPPDFRGYVEPNPEFYAKLYSLTDYTQQILGQDKNTIEDWGPIFDIMKNSLMKLKTISEKELENKSLTEDEHDFIKNFGGDLEHISYSLDELLKNDSDEKKAPIIADIATDPNGNVLEIGTGKVLPIYVIVPVEGVLKVTIGGVYSYYEFPWPINDRLTDSKWRDMLEKPDSPTMPDWTKEFIVK
jgi:hypothetical protein